jgi:transposase
MVPLRVLPLFRLPARAASHTKQTHVATRYRRLAAKRGANRAIIAIAHNLLLIAYYRLKHARPYHDLGGDYFDRINSQVLTRYLVRRRESLGHNVCLTLFHKRHEFYFRERSEPDPCQ